MKKMKFIDWIKGLFNKNKLIDAPKQEEDLSKEEQFRKIVHEKAELSPEEKESIEKEARRKEQLRIAGYDVISTTTNMDNEDIKASLSKRLLSLQMEELMRKGVSKLATEIVLTDLDIETLKHMHYAIQRDSNLVSYLNGIDKTTNDNNIIEVVDRIEQIAKNSAKENGYMESQATKFMPNASNIIYDLQQEQQQEQQEQE